MRRLLYNIPIGYSEYYAYGYGYVYSESNYKSDYCFIPLYKMFHGFIGMEYFRINRQTETLEKLGNWYFKKPII